MTGKRSASVGLAVVVVSAVVYWLASRDFDAGRGDFFYLADAFLHGRTWLENPLGPFDVIPVDGRYYVPFAPFPAVALMPVVAVMGAVGADQVESGINALLAAGGVGLCWWLLGRIGVARTSDRVWLTVLFAFSTQILWVTGRGGVWHTGHLVATVLTFGCLIELWGARRAWLIGLLAGAAFLTRAPLAFAIPFYALLLWPTADRLALPAIPWRRWTWLAAGVAPSIVFFFAYNVARFGTPLESGYALATLPDWLERQRAMGLFAIAHIPMNLDYFLIHLPAPIAGAPVLPARRSRDVRPDHESGPAVRGPGRLARPPGLVAGRRIDRCPRPDLALLRWWVAPVRLPLLPRFGAARDRAVRTRGGPSWEGRERLEGADRVRDGRDGRRCLLGPQPVIHHGAVTLRR